MNTKHYCNVAPCKPLMAGAAGWQYGPITANQSRNLLPRPHQRNCLGIHCTFNRKAGGKAPVTFVTLDGPSFRYFGEGVAGWYRSRNGKSVLLCKLSVNIPSLIKSSAPTASRLGDTRYLRTVTPQQAHSVSLLASNGVFAVDALLRISRRHWFAHTFGDCNDLD